MRRVSIGLVVMAVMTMPSYGADSLVVNGAVVCLPVPVKTGEAELCGSVVRLLSGSTGADEVKAETGESEECPSALSFQAFRTGRSNWRFAVAVPRGMAGYARIGVFDVMGRRVAELVAGELESGWHSVTWAGRSSSGLPVASGVYFARMCCQSQTMTARLVIVR